MNLDYELIPEVLIRLIREGLEIKGHLILAERNIGYLTLREAIEEYSFWKERLSKFYKDRGWNNNLIEILDNNIFLGV